MDKQKQIEEMARALIEYFDKTPMELTYEHPNGRVEDFPDDFYMVINDITRQAIIPFVSEVLIVLGYRKQIETAEKFAERLKAKVKARYKLLGSCTCYGDIEYEIDESCKEITEEKA